MLQRFNGNDVSGKMTRNAKCTRWAHSSAGPLSGCVQIEIQYPDAGRR